MPGNSTRYTLPDWIENLSFEHALKLLLLYFTGGTVPPASGGGGIPSAPPTVTPNFFAPTAGQTVIIPVGAIGASVLILTGTGTLNTVDQPLGVPWTEPGKLAATVTLVLGSPGTARVYYGT